MAQQINLYSPILLVPKRYFSALAMLQALGVLVLGLGAISLWSVQHTHGLKRDLASARDADGTELQRLQTALARLPAPPSNLSALEQELAQARQQVAGREALLAAVSTPEAGSAVSRSSLLRVLAQTLPPSAWLTEVKLDQGRIELAGATLQPEALRPWLDTLAAHPALGGKALQAVKVERRGTGTGADTDANANANASPGRESWSFRVVSARDPAVPAQAIGASTHTTDAADAAARP